MKFRDQLDDLTSRILSRMSACSVSHLVHTSRTSGRNLAGFMAGSSRARARARAKAPHAHRPWLPWRLILIMNLMTNLSDLMSLVEWAAKSEWLVQSYVALVLLLIGRRFRCFAML